jgi:hypothetical protein
MRRWPGRVARLVPATLVALSVALGPAAAQHPPSYGVSAELVMIDLVAADGDGRFVTDLRADEIELLEDGKPQPVAFLPARFPKRAAERASRRRSWPTRPRAPRRPLPPRRCARRTWWW